MVLKPDYSVQEIGKKLSYKGVPSILHRTVHTGFNQDTKWEAYCITGQVYRNIRISSLRNRCLTGLTQLSALLNTAHKTPVSLSAVKRLCNANLLGREKQEQRLTNGKKRLKWTEGNRYS